MTDIGSFLSAIVGSEKESVNDGTIVSSTTNSWYKSAESIKDKLDAGIYNILVSSLKNYDRDSFSISVEVGQETTTMGSSSTIKKIMMNIKGTYSFKLFAHLKTLYISFSKQ